MDTPLPGPGDRFGNYFVDSEIAKGGFSVVLKCHRADGSAVAVKVLAPQDASVKYSDNLAERFAREARLLAQIRSPFTVQLLEYGQDDATGLLFMVFELVEGLSLFELIKTEGAQEYTRMLAILKQCLMGLNRAHAVGILHRDIKPNNIMLFSDDLGGDRVKVIDFGIAKRLDDGAQDLTSVGTIVGTPRYMSPEQIRCRDLSPTSDIYSLGLCMVELLTARKAVWGKSRTDVITRQLAPAHKVPIPDHLPPAVFAIVSRMVEKIPGARYQTVDEVLSDIDRYNQAVADHKDGDTVYQTVTDDVIQSMVAPLDQAPDDQTVLQSIRIDSIPNLHAPAYPTDVTVMASDIDRTVASGERERFRDSGQHLPQIPVDDSRNWVHAQTPQPFNQATPSSQRILTSPLPDEPLEFQVHDQTEQNALPLVLASFVLPGIGHLLSGLRAKGVIFLVGWFMFLSLSAMFMSANDKGILDYLLGIVSGLILLTVIATAVLDLWLSLRANKRRDVKPLEFLPDIADVIERLK